MNENDFYYFLIYLRQQFLIVQHGNYSHRQKALISHQSILEIDKKLGELELKKYQQSMEF